MNKAVALALLAGGILLIIFGINASESISSEISEAFTGSPSDKTVWLLVAGVIAAVIGLVTLARANK